MRALIVGASGYVGGRLLAHLGPDHATGTSHSRGRVGLIAFDAAKDRLSDLLSEAPGDYTHLFVFYGVVNPNQCAKDPQATAAINVDAAIRLMSDAQNAGLIPVYLSTDYVFDGSRPFRMEDEPTCPTTEYGRQKAAVENWLIGTDHPWLIARLSKVVGPETDTHSVLGQWVNDIRDMRAMRSATDQVFSPAWVDDIARALAELARLQVNGIVHVAGDAYSRFDLNRLLVEAVKSVDSRVVAEVEPCLLGDIPFAEPRPLNTSLSTSRMASILPWSFTSMADLSAMIANRYFSGKT